jgi:hypothetical protein
MGSPGTRGSRTQIPPTDKPTPLSKVAERLAERTRAADAAWAAAGREPVPGPCHGEPIALSVELTELESARASFGEALFDGDAPDTKVVVRTIAMRLQPFDEPPIPRRRGQPARGGEADLPRFERWVPRRFEGRTPLEASVLAWLEERDDARRARKRPPFYLQTYLWLSRFGQELGGQSSSEVQAADRVARLARSRDAPGPTPARDTPSAGDAELPAWAEDGDAPVQHLSDGYQDAPSIAPHPWSALPEGTYRVTTSRAKPQGGEFDSLPPRRRGVVAAAMTSLRKSGFGSALLDRRGTRLDASRVVRFLAAVRRGADAIAASITRLAAGVPVPFDPADPPILERPPPSGSEPPAGEGPSPGPVPQSLSLARSRDDRLRYLRWQQPPQACGCDRAGPAWRRPHVHCVVCNDATPFFQDGSGGRVFSWLPLTPFCSERCWNALWDALRGQDTAGEAIAHCVRRAAAQTRPTECGRP